MILGIMQPYFFPYLGHYQLILATDLWVVFDNVRYSRRSWMNRNRVLHPTAGWQYVSVPVAGAQDQLLATTVVVDLKAARRRIMGQLAHYRGRAPHFTAACGLVEAAFARTDTDKLRDLNIQSLAVVCEFLDIHFDWRLGSSLDLDPGAIHHAGQWALEICRRLGAEGYINPPGGRDIFHPADWSIQGIDLRFINPTTLRYETAPYAFVDNMSIIDVLMWNDKAKVRDFLSSTMEITA